MATSITVPLGSLLLDRENPRVAEGPENQRDALAAVLRAEERKTLRLARDIATRGLNPTERMAVIPSATDSKLFIVVEGNRRLAALRLLSDPRQNGAELLDQAVIRRLEQWSKEYAQRPIRDVECILFATREDANPWIELRHSGQAEGAGVVPWGSMEQMRFAARRNGRRSPELQVFDFVTEHGKLGTETREKLHDFAITNLQRLVDDAAVRKRLGIDIDEEKCVLTPLPDDEVLRGLTRLVRDIAAGMKVSEIYDAQKRAAYMDRIKRDLPDLSKASNAPRAIASAGDSGVPPTKGSAKKKTRRAAGRDRKTVASRQCKLNIQEHRIGRIYGELQAIDTERFTNAAAVLFRVFLELTVDHHIKVLGITLPSKKDTLAAKLSVLSAHLVKTKVLDKNEGRMLDRAANDKRQIGVSVVTFNQYVHNKQFNPLPSELRLFWDSLQFFFEKVWT